MPGSCPAALARSDADNILRRSAAHQLTYPTIINLKNGKLKREEPRLLQRLLGCLAVPTERLHYSLTSKTPCFLLPDAGALATFRDQLNFLTAQQ